jgi:phosphoinositide-3-kinase, regulatory subunit 4
MDPAMDIFSAGCVLVETFLNGERALDLGDLMEYRKRKASQSLQQKLNKIEFSAMRAACKHMMNLDPNERLSAGSYIERLQATELIPKSFETMAEMMARLQNSAPDTRLAVAALYYHQLVRESMGVDDKEGKSYVEKILGKAVRELGKDSGSSSQHKYKFDASDSLPASESVSHDDPKSDPDDLFAETEALLKKLEALTFDGDGDEVMSVASKASVSDPPSPAPAADSTSIKTSAVEKSSLLVYLQLILSTVRCVQRPASKLVALQLMERLATYSSDEARLQRIVPVAVSLLQDQDPVVRAVSISTLTSTISIVETFPPSDSKVFPQYLFKRVSHMITDPSLIVRLAFARNIAVLAETSQRFLDISHAVRLYEVADSGSGGTSTSSDPSTGKDSTVGNVFADDVAKLLDDSAKRADSSSGTAERNKYTSKYSGSGAQNINRTLISNTYNAELSALQEVVSRFVVHIATDQSEHSSPVKRALLQDIARLCNFFGTNGVMAFILPQILSFLNDRKDWQLRASLFDCLPSVCHIIGRAATEHFVLPCLETALVDGEEVVVSRGLCCLSELIEMGLLSRSVILGSVDAGGVETAG